MPVFESPERSKRLADGRCVLAGYSDQPRGGEPSAKHGDRARPSSVDAALPPRLAGIRRRVCPQPSHTLVSGCCMWRYRATIPRSSLTGGAPPSAQQAASVAVTQRGGRGVPHGPRPRNARARGARGPGRGEHCWLARRRPAGGEHRARSPARRNRIPYPQGVRPAPPRAQPPRRPRPRSSRAPSLHARAPAARHFLITFSLIGSGTRACAPR